MRIIAGEMRSRKLKAPEGMDTRPTADRVKEALFSILGSRIYGARVLDLYGGSGALALEALSRGADSAVICDLSAKACAVIQENIGSLGCSDRAKLLRMKDTAALSALQKKNDAFDNFLIVCVKAQQAHAQVDHADQRCADDHSEDPAGSAVGRYAADDAS